MQDYQDYGWVQSQTPAHLYLLPTLLKVLGPRQDRRILDLGCGSGFLAKKLLDLGFDVYGADASTTGISLASQTHPGRFFVINSSIHALPRELQGRTFDTVIATEVIEHLYDPAGFIRFCHAILPLGGELILSTPYHGYLKNLALALAGAMDNHFTALWPGGHIKFWSRKTLAALVDAEGFTVTRFMGSGRLPFLWKSMFLASTRNSPSTLGDHP
ncbi:MAG: methyltransferase domain-containing protein [Geothrix sp.]|nr:methyltransferase domain-containing protein [Geothrix sp.]